ncbi:uncharacterized protein LOC126651033 [Myiozetetes cayanensis]|uniref:uncharacterized protein LOC126651033 n=1 Tax=Myiozetetes cayanensis TaxID=478635 RepID=UPI002160FA86|nr:uncharacterized protein LOC126651033 [Myiozetetes cayanensis]XP_050192468.1 uncharacterized protein LOC126651033 [Myiozetetes cayanensis]XP_050192469.1 uncharacterized protein LOC126651033 [Myiozetetes cayanensis]XP_050192470.1 uncharacterized protein LOC126651033 [Myiozetetes cayanensis]XP_050192471.1 uncharacterized protein LOC126651033 [Myiozetetes cayanensis]
MVWEKFLFLFYGCTILSQLTENEDTQPNLAWELIQGFMHIWNHTNQGICINLPNSASEGLRFMMIWLNFSEILTRELDNLKKTGGNVTWGMIESPFLDQKEGQQWAANGTWVEYKKAFYQLPHNSTWNHLWNQTCYRSLDTNPSETLQNVTSIPCTVVPWWDSPTESAFFEHEYNLHWDAGWCIQIPSNPGTPHQVNQTNYEWAWSLKQIFDPISPLQWASRTPTGDIVEWEVGKSDCKDQQITLPNGESICWKVRNTRSIIQSKSETSFLNCSRILDCTTGAGEPIETWYISELRTFIRDMCTCWGYPNYGYLNRDTRCNGSYENSETALSCGIPVTHGPDPRRVLNSSTEAQEVPRGDLYQCSQAKYPAPRGTVWACSDGKMYSHLNMYDMAGLQCTIGFPTMCPSKTFNYTLYCNKKVQREIRNPVDAKGWIGGIQVPDYYTWGQNVALDLELFFVPSGVNQRHQYVLENLTRQIHVLSNWTERAYGKLNLQAQQVPKMALQNRLALDMVLLKEHGVCGMLNLTDGECCVTVHNAATTMEEARQKMKEVAEQTGELFQAMQPKE